MYISALFYAMLEILGDGGKVHVRLAVHPVKEESLSRLISYLVVVELSVPPHPVVMPSRVAQTAIG